MPKYLWQVSYTQEGARGIAKEGGSSRRKQAEDLIRSLGGKLESFYYAFGESDLFVIGDLPDSAAATALSLAVITGGGAVTKTVVLVTPEEVDEAIKRNVSYRPPGK